jgi:seryl-tRNA synthetase
MLDIRLIRDEPDAVKAGLARRGADPALIDQVLAHDAARRQAQARADELRGEQKSAGRDVAKLQGDEKAALLARLKDVSAEIAACDATDAAEGEAMRELLLRIPNVPLDIVPTGKTEDENEILKTVGDVPTFDFAVRDHLEIGEALGIIDMERGARMSGSRFSVLRGAAVTLWQALARYAMEIVVAHGHTPVLPPVLVRREAMEGTGFFPAAEDQIYHVSADELYLVGTSEVPLAAMHMDEILDGAALPLRYVGHSACFRREAGALGKDTRGIFRNHQFEKVEMFVFTTPEDSAAEHERLIGIEEEVLAGLGLPYRVVALCTGDLGAPSARTVDLEVWFPGQDRYRETTSCSNTTDYQARRLNVRTRGADGTRIVHTLNGTAATSSRHLAAILENYQQADGSVAVPKVLQPYVGAAQIGP